MPDLHQETTITEITRLVRLSYLQTISALDDPNVLSNLAGTSAPRNSSFSASDPGSPGFLGIGGDAASSLSSSFSDSGWAISRTWLETYWDKIRWAIGIKDIGLFTYEYASIGEIVSAEFKYPAEIEKVTLKVDEFIPLKYPNTQKWIHYFVTADNGANWYRINPLDTTSTYSGNGFVPRILNFNSEFISENDDSNRYIRTESPVKSLRFKAVLLRPTGDEFKESSPILKGYRLLSYIKNGLI